tara:strand:+ start:390 stop:839 length:450 start_codon:yes stop_codon:yes gene_type:complete
MHQVYVSIGSNIDPKRNIAIVKSQLNSLFDCTFSSLYETIAEGFEGNNFINCVVGFETDLEPIKLRENLKKIEKNMGRTLSQKGMSNRVIDLDLILYGNLVTEDKNFDIPSKDLEHFAFILEPLVEIARDLKHPISKRSFSSILKCLRS